MNMIKVSIIIPTKNRLEFLKQAMESVCNKIAIPHEILIIDNASSDGTEAYCKQLQNIQYIRNAQDLGMVGNWNRGLAEAKGEYIKILCDDDYLLSGAVEREVAMLDKNPNIFICASSRLEVDRQTITFAAENIEKTGIRKSFTLQDKVFNKSKIFRAMMISENIFGGPTAVTFRNHIIKKFSEHYQYAADWAFWIKLIEEGSGAGFIAQPGSVINIHPGNLTKQIVDADRDILEVLALQYRALKCLEDMNMTNGFDYFYFVMYFFYRVLRRCLRHIRLKHLQRIPHFLVLLVMHFKNLPSEEV